MKIRNVLLFDDVFCFAKSHTGVWGDRRSEEHATTDNAIVTDDGLATENRSV